MRVAGCDLGQAVAKLVIADVLFDEASSSGDGPTLRLSSQEVIAHHGRPLEVFREWYQRRGVSDCSGLGATGVHARELTLPAQGGLPEDACLAEGLRVLHEADGPLNLLRVGARGYSVLTRDAAGELAYQENEKCSSSTGETMVKIASRFGLGLEEADRLALVASASIPITARCSVFAKSEMTHFANQGRRTDQLFRGYFGSIARYVGALLERVRVAGPVLFVGGGARLRSLVSALEELLATKLLLPSHGVLFEALGAAALAAERALAARDPWSIPLPLPADPCGLFRERERRFTALPPPRALQHRVSRLAAPSPAAGATTAPTVLGLDLGSTGSKLVLTSLASGEPVLDIYDATRGNPVDATRRLVAALLARVSPDVRAIGVTGSGREAAATLLRACYPALQARLLVVNEIVAHATAAIRCDPDGGRSLSVVEIGGQDAKFIQIVDGQIVESDLNKACSAGTGSFLAEQARCYGIDEIEAFSALAAQAQRPPDLGQMCTVFVAQAATEAQDEGYELPDLCAGFQLSVIHNFKNRVMGQRSFGDRIFFQGKPASSPSLGWALAQVADRPVTVPSNPGAMGAWGIGLCVRDELDVEALRQDATFELSAIVQAEIVERSDFRCHDRECATLCVIDRTKVSVRGAERTVVSGGACPKFEVSSTERPKLPVGAPNAFAERDALLEPYRRERAGATIIGLPEAGPLAPLLPWAVTLLAELGFGVRVLRSTKTALGRGEARCYSYDACAPAKVFHGVTDVDLPWLFLPKVLDLPAPQGGERLSRAKQRQRGRDEAAEDRGRGNKTCPLQQALPELIEQALRAGGRATRVLRPVLSFDAPLGEQAAALARALFEAGLLGDVDRTAPRLLVALQRAGDEQRRVGDALARIGERSLAYARARKIPLVVACGALHVIHDPAINAGIPGCLVANGVLALPMDCYYHATEERSAPAGRSELPELDRAVWSDARRFLSVALSARRRGDVYPLLLSSFGCGPSSFAEQVFSKLLEGYPHTALETDGHGGTAGYVTRIQAFLHAVRRHAARRQAASASSPPPVVLRALEPLPQPPLETLRDARLVVFSIADRLAALTAAYYRSMGFDAVAAGPNGRETLRHGRADCSGKECLPYQLIWGAFREHLLREPPRRRTVLLQLSGAGMCRNCMFSVKDQLSLERLGLAERVSLRHIGPEPGYEIDFAARYWSAVVVWDILHQLLAYLRPVAGAPEALQALYEETCDRLVALLSRPPGGRLRRILSSAEHWRSLTRLLDEAALGFASQAPLPAQKNGARSVLLSGDIYLRLDEVGNDQLVRRLNQRGLHVLVEPTSVLVEYMADERSSEIIGLPTTGHWPPLMRRALPALRRRLYQRARRVHRWLPDPDVRAMQREARRVLDRYPIGEAPICLGSVLHSWSTAACDGAVVVSPWGCGPALVAESLLRHQRAIPILFVYSDGSPLDESRLDAFAFRLERRAARTAPAAGIARPW